MVQVEEIEMEREGWGDREHSGEALRLSILIAIAVWFRCIEVWGSSEYKASKCLGDHIHEP